MTARGEEGSARASGAGAFSPDLVERLAALEDRSWWFKGRTRLIVWAVGRYFPDARGFLDVGCGTGVVLQALSGAFPLMELSGCDASRAALEVAARRVPDARLERRDAGDLEWAGPVDVVGSFDVLEHVDDDLCVLSAMTRAARGGGGVLVTVPQHGWLWSSFDALSGHVRRYDARRVRMLFAEAGIEVIRMTSFVSIALPVMAAARLGGRGGRASGHPSATGPDAKSLDTGRAGANDPLRSLDPGPVASGILDASLAAERALIRVGGGLPAGGSLLVVGRT